MKEISKTIIHGIITGVSAALAIFLIVLAFEDRYETNPYTILKKHFEITETKFTPAVASTREDAMITTVTFKIDIPKRKKISAAFIDYEFFDSNDVFIFGGDVGNMWGDHLLAPKSGDNMSFEAYIPSTIDFTKASRVTVDVYELERE